MIIVEGMDGSGKTTLIQQLRENHGLPHGPRFSESLTGPKADLGRLVRADLNGWCRMSCHIYDRYPFISEFIYGPIIRGAIQPSLMAVDKAYYQYFMANALVILCQPPYWEIKKNLREDQQAPGVIDKDRELYFAYSDMEVFLLTEGCEVIPYDYTRQNVSELSTWVESHKKGWRK